jgi:hypothetical protein
VAERKTIYLPDEIKSIIDAAPGNSLSSKIAGIVTRYGEIITVRPELAITPQDAARERIEKELKPKG